MAQVIDVPGMGRVEFPDGMSDAQMASAIKANMPKSVMADRIPGNAPAREQTGDIVSSSAIRGIAGLAGLPVDALNLLRTLRNKAQGTDYPAFRGGSADIVKGIENVTGTPLYQPEGVGQRGGSPEGYAASTLEGASAGAPFGPTGALLGGIAGAGGEFGERITGSPWGRLVGSLGTSVPAGLFASLRRPTGSVLNDVLEGTTPQQMRDAQRLVDNARTQGITLTGPEAIAQVKGSSREPVLGIQRVVEQSRGGGPLMNEIMSDRSGQNATAFGRVLDRVGPQVTDPTSIAPRVQGAAEDVITTARQAGNARARPFYEQAATDRMDQANFSALTKDPVVREAVSKVLKDPFYGVVGQPPTSISVLDAAKKYLDDVASAASKTGENNKARIASGSIDDILRTADSVSPAYPQARSIVAKNMREVVEPLQRQPVGQLAEATTFPAQRKILFPADPETLTPKAVRETITRLRMRDDTAARDLTRQFLETQFEKVTKDLASGGNEYGGALFASRIQGNTKQGENIRAAIQSVGGNDALTGFNRFISIMQAQGKRQAPGSMTNQNKEIADELSRGGIAGELASTAAAPASILTASKDWFRRFQYEGNSADLARIFTDPDSVDRMRRLAMLNPGTERAQALAAVIAALNVPQDGKRGANNNQ